MRSISKKFTAQLRRSETGFTLVELLVVVGIIVALAAVIIPNVARFTGKGTEGADVAEAVNVQTAFDTIMADAGVGSITTRVGANAVNDFSTLPLDSSGNPLQAGNPVGDVYLVDYLRGSIAGFYCWDDGGLVTTSPSWDGTHTC